MSVTKTIEDLEVGIGETEPMTTFTHSKPRRTQTGKLSVSFHDKSMTFWIGSEFAELEYDEWLPLSIAIHCQIREQTGIWDDHRDD